MVHDPPKYHRRSIRLPGYDYAQCGAYFVTLCVQDRTNRFGEIVDDEMVLNDAGQMVRGEWERLPERFPTVELDCYVIMPNHLHGIIIIHNALTDASPQAGQPQEGAPTRGARTELGATTQEGAPTRGARTGRVTLGEVVGVFKSLSTNGYIRGVREGGWPRFERQVWHRNYYEHVIRNDRELGAIREYIVNNPLHWALDRDNPVNDKSGKSI